MCRAVGSEDNDSMNMRTIVLFDPYPISQLGFSQVVKANTTGFQSLVVSSADALARVAGSHAVDLLILTVNTVKNNNALHTLQECRALCPDAPIVLYDEEHYAGDLEKWLKSGVAGYLAKSEPMWVLIQCIEVVSGGGKYLSPEGWTRYLAASPAPQQRPLTGKKLGKRELEVARYLSDGKSTTWIAGTLGKKPSTISTIKKRIFTKLNVDNVVALCGIMASVNGLGMGQVARKVTVATALKQPAYL